MKVKVSSLTQLLNTYSVRTQYLLKPMRDSHFLTKRTLRSNVGARQLNYWMFVDFEGALTEIMQNFRKSSVRNNSDHRQIFFSQRKWKSNYLTSSVPLLSSEVLMMFTTKGSTTWVFWLSLCTEKISLVFRFRGIELNLFFIFLTLLRFKIWRFTSMNSMMIVVCLLFEQRCDTECEELT